MVIAEVRPEGHVRVVERVKEMVRLGRRAFTTGRLSAEASDLAVGAVQDLGRVARARRVDRLRAVATSAVREARNGPALVRRLRRETGIAVRVISGLEEARLIFRAARHALGLDGGPHLLVDVGGGSVELVLVEDGRPLWMRSVRLGAARLTEQYLTDDPPTMVQRKRLEKHLEEEIGGALREARRAGVKPVRRRSVNALAERFAHSNTHGRQVARLALRLFDETALVLALPESGRELLEYAALLHDIGHAIDHDRHNRHSHYLIKNAEL